MLFAYAIFAWLIDGSRELYSVGRLQSTQSGTDIWTTQFFDMVLVREKALATPLSEKDFALVDHSTEKTGW